MFMGGTRFLAALVLLMGLAGGPGGAAAGEGEAAVDTVNPFFFYSRAFEEPPYWAEKLGRDEWQLWVFNRGSRSEGSHGRLYRGEEELLGRQKGQVLESELGRLVWGGAYEERVRNWDHSGWQPAEPGRLAAGRPARSPFLPDYPAWGSLSSQELLHLSWRTNPDGLPQGQYGALRLNGRWVFGQSPGERIKAGGGIYDEYVWHGDLNQPGLNAGWLSAAEEPGALYDPRPWFVGKKPHLLESRGATQWRAWFMELRFMCPVCAEIAAYGQLFQGGREVVGTKRGQTRASELGLFTWTPESGWLPEDRGLYLVEDCQGEGPGGLNRGCPALKPGLPFVLRWDELE